MVDDSTLVSYAAEDGVGLITLNHPEVRNAWSIRMEQQYFAWLDHADSDDTIRAIVLTGSGQHFCPGLDVRRLEAKSRGVPPPVRTRPISYPMAVRKPLIAAINGTTAGVGLVQAALCDIRFAATGARMATSFTRRGLASEHLLTWLLPRIVGHGHAADLLISGRTFSAEEAAHMGLVNRVCGRDELLGTALAYARDLATNCSPLSMAQVKRQLWEDWLRTPSASLETSEELKCHDRRASELAEGVASLVLKRAPQFGALGPPESQVAT